MSATLRPTISVDLLDARSDVRSTKLPMDQPTGLLRSRGCGSKKMQGRRGMRLRSQVAITDNFFESKSKLHVSTKEIREV
jgi:hypothetical protein